jgi:hypothetical protein
MSQLSGKKETAMAPRVKRILVLLVVFVGSVTPSAHHNMSALFDFDQRFVVSGPLTKIDWRNPHIYLYVHGKDDKGREEDWAFEGPAPTVFRNLNSSRADFDAVAGKEIKVEASRARDGSAKGLIRIVSLPDGKTVSLCPQNC